MIMYHLGPQLGVWIMQVSTFSNDTIIFICILMYVVDVSLMYR